MVECKVIWRSLRDAVRYRKNKIAKTADGGDESRDELEEYEMDSTWEFSDCMSFLINDSLTLSKRPRRYVIDTVDIVKCMSDLTTLSLMVENLHFTMILKHLKCESIRLTLLTFQRQLQRRQQQIVMTTRCLNQITASRQVYGIKVGFG